MACISETAVCKVKITSVSTPWGRKRVYVELLELWPMAKFHAQIFHGNFATTAHYEQKHSSKSKLNLAPTPVVVREYTWYMCNFRKFGQSEQVGSQAERQGPWASCLQFCSFWFHIFHFLCKTRTTRPV